jgi:hypothetical protein
MKYSNVKPNNYLLINAPFHHTRSTYCVLNSRRPLLISPPAVASLSAAGWLCAPLPLMQARASSRDLRSATMIWVSGKIAPQGNHTLYTIVLCVEDHVVICVTKGQEAVTLVLLRPITALASHIHTASSCDALPCTLLPIDVLYTMPHKHAVIMQAGLPCPSAQTPRSVRSSWPAIHVTYPSSVACWTWDMTTTVACEWGSLSECRCWPNYVTSAKRKFATRPHAPPLRPTPLLAGATLPQDRAVSYAPQISWVSPRRDGLWSSFLQLRPQKGDPKRGGSWGGGFFRFFPFPFSLFP